MRRSVSREVADNVSTHVWSSTWAKLGGATAIAGSADPVWGPAYRHVEDLVRVRVYDEVYP